MQRSKQVAMGRKKFNMDPKKVRERLQPVPVLGKVGGAQGLGEAPANGCQPCPLESHLLCVPGSPALPPPVRVPAGLKRRASLLSLQGIQFLIENDLLKNTCEDIAQFLCRGEGLNKTAIGDYLGER